ncbi:hypothetical protein FKM82_010498 [Ascaphus truei]
MEEGEGLRQRRPIRPQVITDETLVQETKSSSTYSGKIFCATFIFLALSVLIPSMAAICLLESPIEPQYLSLQVPPLMTGVLEVNLKLRKAERLYEGQLVGPESIANIGDVLFTGTADGQILKLEDGNIHTVARLGKSPCGTRENEPNCGRPLGIRVGPNGTLFIADAYQGIFEVNPVTGAVEMLVSSKVPVQGKIMSFVNDLAVTHDGRKIYFTDSSSKWQRRDYPYLAMEGTDDGRLLEYDTRTKEVKVLMGGLRFPNGVQLSPAEDFLLVAETTMARVRRYICALLSVFGSYASARHVNKCVWYN